MELLLETKFLEKKRRERQKHGLEQKKLLHIGMSVRNCFHESLNNNNKHQMPMFLKILKFNNTRRLLLSYLKFF